VYAGPRVTILTIRKRDHEQTLAPFANAFSVTKRSNSTDLAVVFCFDLTKFPLPPSADLR